MTANDAETLLRTYADAFEIAHPLPADQARVPVHFVDAGDEPIPALDLPLLDSPAQPRMGQLTTAALALAAVLALVIGFVLLDDDSDGRTGDGTGASGFVFEGEIVVREVPLVVIANQPVEPTFDTSDLGTRVVYTSPLDLDDAELDATVDRLINSTELLFAGREEVEIQRIALHASLEDGPIGVAIADLEESNPQPGETEGPIRRRLVFFRSGGTISGQSSPDDAPTLLRPAETYAEHVDRNLGEQGLSFAGGGAEEGVGEVTIELEVSLDIAVVQIIVDGERFWTVPIDGLTYFTLTMALNTQFELITYDADGDVVTSKVTGFPG